MNVSKIIRNKQLMEGSSLALCWMFAFSSDARQHQSPHDSLWTTFSIFQLNTLLYIYKVQNKSDISMAGLKGKFNKYNFFS